MTQNWNPEDEERLRRALHEEAAAVVPAPGGLERILARTRRGGEMSWWRSPAVLGVATALVVAVAAVGVALAMFGDTDEPPVAGPGAETTSPEPRPTPDTSPEPTPEPTEEPTRPTIDPEPGFVGAIPIYYATETSAGWRLAREWRHVETERTAAEEAVASLFAPSTVPGYGSLWNPATEVNSVEIRDGAIKVDLSLPEMEAVGLGEPELAVQQLVYTATAVMAAQGESTQAVRILADGEQIDELGGVDVSEPLRRADPLEVRQFVQLNDPSQDSEVRSPVQVSGDAAVFEATVLWEVTQNGEVIESDFTTAEECCRFAPFSFEVELPAGEYTITISETDPSDGEGREPMSDSRTFTVSD